MESMTLYIAPDDRDLEFDGEGNLRVIYDDGVTVQNVRHIDDVTVGEHPELFSLAELPEVRESPDVATVAATTAAATAAAVVQQSVPATQTFAPKFDITVARKDDTE